LNQVVKGHLKRLLWRLYPSYLFITLFALLAVSWYFSVTMKEFFLGQKVEELKARAIIFREIFTSFMSLEEPGEINEFCKKIGSHSGIRITVIIPSGKVIGDSNQEPGKMENHGKRPEFLRALSGEIGDEIRYSSTLQERMLYVAIPVEQENSIVAVIRTAISLAVIDKTFESISYKIIGGGILVAFLAAGISLVVSRWLSSPLEKMTLGAQLFAKGELSHRLFVPRTKEMASLAIAMNQMANQLDEKIKIIIRHRNELEAVLSSMKEGVIAFDLDERILRINQMAAAMFNKDPWEMENRSIQETIRNSDLHKFTKNALKKGDGQECDIVFYQEKERILNVRSTALLDAKEERIGILIVLNDVTRLRRLESMRQDFVANVSHEIKTPLTAILGFVETLLQDYDKNPENTRRFLSIIDRHAQRLFAIIEDLLNLSRIERISQQKEIGIVQAPVDDVIRTAVQVLEAKAEEKKIRIDFKSEGSLSAEMDSTLIEQAVVNLLDNALKYSSPGSAIEVHAKEKNGVVQISIRDYGIGIENEHLSRIFERFYRVDKARSRKLGGTGLGLSIVKHIIQAHDGKVTVESSPGKGSTFTIHFPVKRELSAFSSV
jgi:two-component system, OmpR family, phosphate regulon sensor histidine kinase PhoR